MTKRKTVFGAAAKGSVGTFAALAALAGCGGGAKPAAAPASCPEGTVLQGTDCLPATASGKDADEATPPTPPSSKSPADDSSAHAPPSATESASSPPASDAPGSGGAVPYDKDAIEAQLKRGARSVKASCGAATDDDGEANGPWGKTKASVTLGRNGHVKQVTVPPPTAERPRACAWSTRSTRSSSRRMPRRAT